jgi:fructokinase
VSGDGVIVVGGEALVDLVVGPDGELAAHPGGGPFNTARTLGRLEQPVLYLGRISEDRFGRRLRGELADDGVRLDAVVPTSDPTTLALAETDAHGAASYGFYTEGTSVPGLTVEDALGALPDRVEVLHVGTLGLMLEPVRTALEAAVAAVADHALVMVDPNVRPTLIPDRAAYRRRLGTTLRRSHVVKASVDDLAWLEPGTSPAETARGMLAEGPAAVLMTDGGNGVEVIMPSGQHHVPAPQVKVVDTIGAGDAFSGGFLAWWRMHGLGAEDLRAEERVLEATAFACEVAALTCERAGASPPRLAELRR